MDFARKFKWVESMLEHAAGQDCDTDDASEWLFYYLGKHHNTSFTVASESLGYLLEQQITETAAEAMWADAKIYITPQEQC
jgi:hypothetical protein